MDSILDLFEQISQKIKILEDNQRKLKSFFNLINKIKTRIFLSGLIYTSFNYAIMIIFYLPTFALMSSSFSIISPIIQLISYLFIFPVYILSSLTIPIIVSEKKGPIKSIKRSVSLVKKNFWSILGINLIYYLILYGIIIIITIFIAILVGIGSALKVIPFTLTPAFIIIGSIGFILSIILILIISIFIPIF